MMRFLTYLRPALSNDAVAWDSVGFRRGPTRPCRLRLMPESLSAIAT